MLAFTALYKLSILHYITIIGFLGYWSACTMCSCYLKNNNYTNFNFCIICQLVYKIRYVVRGRARAIKCAVCKKISVSGPPPACDCIDFTYLLIYLKWISINLCYNVCFFVLLLVPNNCLFSVPIVEVFYFE